MDSIKRWKPVQFRHFKSIIEARVSVPYESKNIILCLPRDIGDSAISIWIEPWLSWKFTLTAQ